MTSPHDTTESAAHEQIAGDDVQSPALRGRPRVLIAYGIIAMLGAAFFAFSLQYEFLKDGGLVGPGFLPRISAAMLAVLGLLLIVQELRGGSTLTGDSGIAGDDSKLSRRTVIKLVSVFALITVALLLSPVLGLVVSLGLLVLVLTAVVERMPVIPSVIATVAAMVVAYGLFVVVLQVPLPMGIFEGLLP